jgi:hypothetical protein
MSKKSRLRRKSKMANDDTAKSNDTPVKSDPGAIELPQMATSTDVLSGVDKLLDGQIHTGVAVLVSSDGSPSTLMIPDISGISKGAPVYITKPVRINGKNLKAFLANKKVDLPEQVSNLIEDTQISCEAFYYSQAPGPLLMMFALKFEDGLIESLTGDADLGKLFDIQGASVRILRGSQTSADVLKKYAAGLSA